MSQKPFNAQQDLVNEETKKRAALIDETAQKVLDLMVEKDLTVNDLQVIVNQITQQLQLVFLSHKCSAYIETKKAE